MQRPPPRWQPPPRTVTPTRAPAHWNPATLDYNAHWNHDALHCAMHHMMCDLVSEPVPRKPFGNSLASSSPLAQVPNSSSVGFGGSFGGGGGG
eukprot:scaffold50116_cov53-Phaeocystis_antarctica.AAC.3